MEIEDKNAVDLIRRAALKFLGDEPKIHEQFDLDTTWQRLRVPPPPSPAPPMLGQILAVLSQNSHLIWSIFAALVIQLFFYFQGRRVAERDKKEFVLKVSEILKQNQEQIATQLRANKKLQSKLRRNPQWIIIRLLDKKSTIQWETPLKVYTERLKVLSKVDGAGEIIIKIFEELADRDSKE